MTLSILIWLPLAVGVLGAFLPGRLSGWLSVAGSLATLGIAVSFIARFHSDSSGLQFVTDKLWISALGIHYKLGLDGLNVLLVLVTTIVFAAAMLWSAGREWDRPRVFYFNFLLAESAVLGAFCAQDLALFIIFFDLMLLPFYFLSGIWGDENRVAATTKFVIYTLVGSFFMLVAAIATGVLSAGQHGVGLDFAFSALQAHPLSHTSQIWIFMCFAVAFLVKMPLVPFHGWLADGYKTMPIPAVAVFSAILSKVAAYGFLRIVLPLFPYAAVHFQTLMLVIALVSIIWGTLVAMTQPDARMVVAYSSVAQPRAGHGAAVLHRRGRRGPRRRLGEARRHGRNRVPSSHAGDTRAGGDVRDARHPRLRELRRRVPDPARRLQHQASDRDPRLYGRRRRRRLRAAVVHPLDAQPRRGEGDVV
jgi:NADH-quinone oxidoreductase subunit M